MQIYKDKKIIFQFIKENILNNFIKLIINSQEVESTVF